MESGAIKLSEIDCMQLGAQCGCRSMSVLRLRASNSSNRPSAWMPQLNPVVSDVTWAKRITWKRAADLVTWSWRGPARQTSLSVTSVRYRAGDGQSRLCLKRGARHYSDSDILLLEACIVGDGGADIVRRARVTRRVQLAGADSLLIW